MDDADFDAFLGSEFEFDLQFIDVTIDESDWTEVSNPGFAAAADAMLRDPLLRLHQTTLSVLKDKGLSTIRDAWHFIAHRLVHSLRRSTLAGILCCRMDAPGLAALFAGMLNHSVPMILAMSDAVVAGTTAISTLFPISTKLTQESYNANKMDPYYERRALLSSVDDLKCFASGPWFDKYSSRPLWTSIVSLVDRSTLEQIVHESSRPKNPYTNTLSLIPANVHAYYDSRFTFLDSTTVNVAQDDKLAAEIRRRWLEPIVPMTEALRSLDEICSPAYEFPITRETFNNERRVL